jgi:inorganic pyrophosphatase/exopolyphosphatase
MPDILVTAKVNPDLDGTACTLAYADLLNRSGFSAEGLVFGSPQTEVEYFVKKRGIPIPTAPPDYQNNWQKFVLVDMSAIKGAPPVVHRDDVVEIIDHREGIEGFPNAKIQNDLIGAAATIVVERFIKHHLLPQSDHAQLLFGAIFHNTLNLVSSNTTSRDLSAVRFLETAFALNRKLISEMFDFATASINSDIYKAIYSDAKEFALYNRKIGFYQLVVWSFAPRLRSQVQSAVEKIDQEMGCSWSLTNIAELKNKHSSVYCSGSQGQRVISKALGVTFSDSWTVLKPVLLRKQILPKINALFS